MVSETTGPEQRQQPLVPDGTPSQDQIDESLEESFPASDPPSWIAVARIGSPKRKLQDSDDSD
jgi:hypothetical protein